MFTLDVVTYFNQKKIITKKKAIGTFYKTAVRYWDDNQEAAVSLFMCEENTCWPVLRCEQVFHDFIVSGSPSNSSWSSPSGPRSPPPHPPDTHIVPRPQFHCGAENSTVEKKGKKIKSHWGKQAVTLILQCKVDRAAFPHVNLNRCKCSAGEL